MVFTDIICEKNSSISSNQSHQKIMQTANDILCQKLSRRKELENKIMEITAQHEKDDVLFVLAVLINKITK